MAKIQIDLRKSLRAIAGQLQSENADRLLNGTAVDGSPLAPRKVPHAAGANAKRIRVHGVRVRIDSISDRVGIATGAMLQDATRASNVKLTRVGFKIVPSEDVLRRWFAFVAGSNHQTPHPVTGVVSKRRHRTRRPANNVTNREHQVARPISGVTDSALRDAKDLVAEDGRAQIVAQINGGIRERRAR